MLSRRGFLGVFGALPVLSHTASRHQAIEDEHSIGPWRVRWMGWQTPPNQPIIIGYFFAYHATDRTRWNWVSTSLGRLQRVRDFGVIDTTRADDAFPLSPRDPESRFTDAKRSAYDRLARALRAAESFEWVEWPNGALHPNNGL